MAGPLKLLIDAAVVRAAGRHLQRAWPAFDRRRFEALALQGLDALELKARAEHLCAALEVTLPGDFDDAAAVIEASLGAPVAIDAPSAPRNPADGLAGWVVWPLGMYVARHGIDAPARALATLHALTQRLTAEWALRPFVERHPALTLATLDRWTRDPSPHVRRLASEGTRPRLPWGSQLKSLIADPSPTLPLLRALQDDPSAYVRRSVANHLNDIARDHPALVAAWIETHLPGASLERAALLRHAARTLVKAGDRRVLTAFGVGRALVGKARLVLSPRRIAIGQALRVVVELRSTARRAQPLAIDYVVHHVKADGSTADKVFKGWKLQLPPGEALRLEKTHAVRPITTRRYHAGQHRVELQVNGRVVAADAFVLSL